MAPSPTPASRVHTPAGGAAGAALRGAPRSGGHRIGAAAALIGASPSALRLWERQGLVRPSRTGGRYRVYSDADVDRLRDIKRLRSVHHLNAPGIRHALVQAGEAPADAPGASDAIHDAPPPGSRLRALRTAAAMSLRAAATASGLSTSFISSLERNATGASIAALRRLTSTYGATLLDLFPSQGPPRRIVRRDERAVLDVADASVRIEQLTSGPAEMEPQLFVLAPGASSEGTYAHAGEEFMFLIEGRLSVWLGAAEHYELTPGDSLYFPSSLAHRWRSDGTSETRVLWINTPPTF